MSGLACGCDPEACWICADCALDPDVVRVDVLRAVGRRELHAIHARKHVTPVLKTIQHLVGSTTDCHLVELRDSRLMFLRTDAIQLTVNAAATAIYRELRADGYQDGLTIVGDVALAHIEL